METSSRYPWGKGTPRWVRDATANDSDKSFTVPAGKIWAMTYTHAEITNTATVGARYLVQDISVAGNTILRLPAGSSSAATQTAVNEGYFGFGAYSATAVQVPMLSGAAPTVGYRYACPEAILPAGSIIRAYDTAAIDAAADDMTVVLHYVEYDA